MTQFREGYMNICMKSSAALWVIGMALTPAIVHAQDADHWRRLLRSLEGSEVRRGRGAAARRGKERPLHHLCPHHAPLPNELAVEVDVPCRHPLSIPRAALCLALACEP